MHGNRKLNDRNRRRGGTLSAENLAEILAECSAENVNCLLDLYNARANLDFLRMFFAANFNPVKKSKNWNFNVVQLCTTSGGKIGAKPI